MPRVIFHHLTEARPDLEAALPKPRQAPPGYSRTSYVVEWLTLNCRADWGSVARTHDVLVRFTDREDRERAVAWGLARDSSPARPRAARRTDRACAPAASAEVAAGAG